MNPSSAPRRAGEPSSDAAGKAPVGEKPTILIVEDEASLRVPVAEILRRRGFHIIESEDGRSAVDLFREKATEIDVVFLDMTLPFMSGAEVLRELSLIRPDAKVVLTSAYTRENVYGRLSGGQPWGYIRKPYSPSELAVLLREASRASTEGRSAAG